MASNDTHENDATELQNTTENSPIHAQEPEPQVQTTSSLEFVEYPDFCIKIEKATGEMQRIILSSLKLPSTATLESVRSALLESEIGGESYDLFFPKWTFAIYFTRADNGDNDVFSVETDEDLRKVLSDELASPGTVAVRLEECKNEKYSRFHGEQSPTPANPGYGGSSCSSSSGEASSGQSQSGSRSSSGTQAGQRHRPRHRSSGRARSSRSARPINGPRITSTSPSEGTPVQVAQNTGIDRNNQSFSYQGYNYNPVPISALDNSILIANPEIVLSQQQHQAQQNEVGSGPVPQQVYFLQPLVPQMYNYTPTYQIPPTHHHGNGAVMGHNMPVHYNYGPGSNVPSFAQYYQPGPPCPPGIQGPSYNQGPMGIQGPTYSPDIQGPTYSPDIQGPSYTQGPPGIQGSTYSPDIQGPAYSPDIQGPTYTQGPSCPQVIQGPTYSPGPSCPPGIPGHSYSSGPSCPPVIQGPTYSSGPSCPPGVPGHSYSSGPSCPPGIPGPANQ